MVYGAYNMYNIIYDYIRERYTYHRNGTITKLRTEQNGEKIFFSHNMHLYVYHWVNKIYTMYTH